MALEFNVKDIGGSTTDCCLRKIHSDRGVMVFCTQRKGHTGRHCAGLLVGKAAVIWDGPEDEATAAMMFQMDAMPK